MKIYLWPNLLWYHEEPVSSNHRNASTEALPAFQECSLAVAPEEPCHAEWVHLASSTDKSGNNTTLRSLLLLFYMEMAVLLCVKGIFSEDLSGTSWFETCGKEWDATKDGQFSVCAIIAVYLSVVHSPWPWQELRWNQLTGWVVRGGTCLNNFSPVGAVVAWADSHRAKLAGFWYSPFGPSMLSFKEQKQVFFWCIAENRALSILFCKTRELRKGLQVTNARVIGWKTGNCTPRSLHCYICQGKNLN